MKRLGVLGTVLALSSALASAGPAAALASAHASVTPQFIAGVTIYNRWTYGFNGQTCLDAEADANGNPNQNGDKVQMWGCSGGTNQRWTVHATQGNWGAITNDASGKCLDAENDATGNPAQNGDKIQLWTCTGAVNQQWLFDPLSGSWGQWENEFFSAMCLDAQNDGIHNPFQDGDRVQIWQCNGATQQQWGY